MQEIGVQHFIRQIKRVIEEQNGRYAFFLGAGCSISSKIPGAARLVEHWLPKLKLDKTGTVDGLDDWVKTQFPGYGNDKAALFYADVMRALFPHPLQRQSEIERIVEGKDPAFGYAVLARLMTTDPFGPRCNVVLTSNFDDLVADALYLYTRKKPLVIAHESLAGFARQSERPLVVKLHGDALLEPLSLKDEVAKLKSGVTRVLANLLGNTGLIFMGYGGNDEGILEALQKLPKEALRWGLYWVNKTVPDNTFGKWLRDRNATWVKHLDFDELMLLARNEFALEHPDEKRFTTLMDTYRGTFEKLSREVTEKPESPDKAALEEAVEKATKEFQNWWSAAIEAYRHSTKSPELADQIYREGIEKFSDNADLLNSYANFLWQVRQDHDGAENQYRKALEADPEHADLLGSYALFLTGVRKDHDKAEDHYRRALEADPQNAIHLGSYANFLWQIRKDHDKAEDHYRRALEADPNNAFNLGNYAGCLLAVGRRDEGWPYSKKARDLADREDLKLELLFYEYAHTADTTERAKRLAEIKKMIVSGVRSPGWDLAQNVERAIADGHPEPKLLAKLAKVIADEDKAEALEAFKAWKKA